MLTPLHASDATRHTIMQGTKVQSHRYAFTTERKYSMPLPLLAIHTRAKGHI